MISFCVIFMLFGFNLAYAITVIRLNNTCNGSNTNLGCFNIPGDYGYEITCPKHNLSEKVRVHYKRFSKSLSMNIKCENFDAKNYCLFSNVITESSKIMKIRFENCPLDKNTVLMDVIKRLGVQHVTILEVSDFLAEDVLSKQQLSGLEDLKSLYLKSKNFSILPENLFEYTTGLESLVLRKNKIASLSAFAGLKNLINLDLGSNQILDLSVEAFKDLNKLEYLYLRNLSLRVLEKQVIESAKSVTKLDISLNDIEELDVNVFTTLENLNEIVLNENKFQYIPMNLFQNNLKLTEFILINNKIPLKTLPNGLLSNLPILQNVTINTGLVEVPDDLFANSTALQTITFSNNTLSTLPVNLFSDQTNLYHLDLRHNQLEHLPDDLFQNTENLMVLQLTDNKIREISANIFNPLSKLEVLCMDNNNIKVLDAKAFMYVTSLRHISLENNDLDLYNEHSPDVSPFQYLVKLQSLHLGNNSISKIYRDWKFQLPRLELLDLSHNHIKTFNSADLLYLSINDLVVNLTYNQIENINFDAIDLLTFPTRSFRVKFDFNYNPIKCNCALLKFSQYLNNEIGKRVKQHLSLEIKHLTCIDPQPLYGKLVNEISPKDLLCSLDTVMDVKNSKPKQNSCPDACECFIRKYDTMLIVNCSKRHLDEVPELPSARLLNLSGTELYIEDNNITILPHNTTPGYKDITKLFMARNDLYKVNDFNLPEGLTHLDVRHNHVCKLSDNVLSIFNSSRMISLKLSHNHWECNCEGVSLLQFVHRNRHIEDFKEMRCHMDPFDKIALQDLTIANICPEEKGPLIASAIVISLLGFCIGLVAALYYKYQQEIKVWLYAHNLCLWFVTEEELDKDKKYDAFISYSHHDEDFVDDLLTELENGPMPYKLCIHKRDWLVGEWVQDQIIRSVQESRRTIVVLSENFIKSVWTRMEFRTAHQEALEEKRPRVIVIIYGEIGDIDNLDPLLKVYLKMNTYLKWGEPNFWNKLHYAMPHASKKLRVNMKSNKKHKMFNNNCHVVMNEKDKLEIVDGVNLKPQQFNLWNQN